MCREEVVVYGWVFFGGAGDGVAEVFLCSWGQGVCVEERDGSA